MKFYVSNGEKDLMVRMTEKARQDLVQRFNDESHDYVQYGIHTYDIAVSYLEYCLMLDTEEVEECDIPF